MVIKEYFFGFESVKNQNLVYGQTENLKTQIPLALATCSLGCYRYIAPTSYGLVFGQTQNL